MAASIEAKCKKQIGTYLFYIRLCNHVVFPIIYFRHTLYFRKIFYASAVMMLLILSVLSSLCLKTYKNHLFQKETQAIDSVFNSLEPNQKVFYMVLDSYSQSAYHTTYLHYPAWYQANKAGFIESNTDLLGNFARLAPFPVRYQPGIAPEVIKNTGEKITINFKQYRYIIIRHQSSTVLSDIFTQSTCQPELLNRVEKWVIYDTIACSR